MSCCKESSVVSFKVAYATKDTQGNATDMPEGIILQGRYPGETEFKDLGTCMYPADSIAWDTTGLLDGMYAFRTVEVTFSVRCKGSGAVSCPVRGEPSDPVGYQLHRAKPAKALPPSIVSPC